MQAIVYLIGATIMIVARRLPGAKRVIAWVPLKMLLDKCNAKIRVFFKKKYLEYNPNKNETKLVAVHDGKVVFWTGSSSSDIIQRLWSELDTALGLWCSEPPFLIIRLYENKCPYFLPTSIVPWWKRCLFACLLVMILLTFKCFISRPLLCDWPLGGKHGLHLPVWSFSLICLRQLSVWNAQHTLSADFDPPLLFFLPSDFPQMHL